MLTPEQQDNVNLMIDHLLSGNYPRGTGMMKRYKHDRYEYCCLGVATEGVLEEEFYPYGVITDTMLYGDGSCYKMTSRDAAKFGFDKPITEAEIAKIRQIHPDHFIMVEEGIPNLKTRQDMLASLNDFGLTFPEIVAVIRSLKWNEE